MGNIGIISDIHANPKSLKKALSILTPIVEEFYILGDIVGYGCKPNECIKILDDIKKTKYIIQGNHDRALCSVVKQLQKKKPERIIDEMIDDYWSPFSSRTIVNHALEISKRGLDLLKQLPKKKYISNRFLLIHGSLAGDLDDYIMTKKDASRNFATAVKRYKNVQYIFYGHTHIPRIYGYDKDRRRSTILLGSKRIKKELKKGKLVFSLPPRDVYMMNPGSSGLERYDLLSCIILNPEKREVTYYNVG